MDEIVLVVCVVLGILRLSYVIGHVHGWSAAVTHQRERDESMRWISDYATGKATMDDAPWKKSTTP